MHHACIAHMHALKRPILTKILASIAAQQPHLHLPLPPEYRPSEGELPADQGHLGAGLGPGAWVPPRGPPSAAGAAAVEAVGHAAP